MVDRVVETWIRTRRPALVGIQGVQGSGKTTLCRTLEARIPGCVAISLDDFYLPDAEIDAEHEDPRLRGRGNPGTHDVAYLSECIARLMSGTEDVDLPVYDKSAHGGRGDRAPETRHVPKGSVETVIVEGWCLGFRPRGIDGDAVDIALREYESLVDLLDIMVVLHADLVWTDKWRAESETAMDTATLESFMSRLRVTSKTYLPYLRVRRDDSILHIQLNAHRQLVSVWT